MHFHTDTHTISGSGGSLVVSPEDEVTRKLLMLIEGECEGLGASAAAAKYGFSKQRYCQLRAAFLAHGSAALHSRKRGPKARSRRTPEVVRQIVRLRFLDPEAPSDVLAQKLRQTGLPISTRSVSRTLADYGLQKKTLPVSPHGAEGHRGLCLQKQTTPAAGRPACRRDGRPAGAGREGQRQPRRPVAAPARAPASGHLGVAHRLVPASRRRRTMSGPATGPRGRLVSEWPAGRPHVAAAWF